MTVFFKNIIRYFGKNVCVCPYGPYNEIQWGSVLFDLIIMCCYYYCLLGKNN